MYRLWHEICLLLSALGVHIELLCFALLSRALVCLWCLLRWMVRHYTAVRLFRAEINNLNGSRSRSLSLSLFCTSALSIVFGVYTCCCKVGEYTYTTYTAAHSPSTYTSIFVCYFCFCCPDQSYQSNSTLVSFVYRRVYPSSLFLSLSNSSTFGHSFHSSSNLEWRHISIYFVSAQKSA
jgi:hypothetical protein